MNNPDSAMARRIADAAIAFEYQRTGHTPSSAAVVISDETLVITLRDALSPAEKALGKSPEGAAQLQEYHRQLFARASHAFRKEIKNITGVEVQAASAELEPVNGTVVEVLPTGTMVQVFLLAGRVATDVWSDGGAPTED